MGLYVYTYADITCVYLMLIWTCVVVSVIIVACGVVSVIIVACSLFLYMCLFVLVNCLMNVFAICVDEVTVLSVRVIVLLL